MKDIEFIKWLCEKAGWEMIVYSDDDIEITPPNKSEDEDFFTDIGTLRSHYAYSILLQLSIEGVNKDMSITTKIWQKPNSVSIHHGGFEIKRYYAKMDHDQAKESALLYIYEQEKPNEGA